MPDRLDAGFAEACRPSSRRALRELSAGEREVIALRVLLELDGDEAGARARDQPDGGLDPAVESPEEARGEGEHPCLRRC